MRGRPRPNQRAAQSHEQNISLTQLSPSTVSRSGRDEKHLERSGHGASNGTLADGLAFELAGDTGNKGLSIRRAERLGSVGDLQPLNLRNGDGHERASRGLRKIVLCA